MSDRKIFLTGVTGKIGKVLLNEIRAKGYSLIVLCRESSMISYDPEIKIVSGDLLDPDGYCSALTGVDTVVHMAAVSYAKDPDEYYNVNSEGTLKLIGKCVEYNVKRFIYVSTWAISEESGHYGRSKLIAERYVKESGLDWVIVRLSEVYGVSENSGLDLILKNIDRSGFLPILGGGNYKIAPVHIRDVISVLERVIEDDDKKYREYNAFGPEILTFKQFIDKVMALKKVHKIKVHVPIWLFKMMASIMSSFLKNSPYVPDQALRLLSEKTWDISLAAHELSYKPAKLEDILGENK